MKKTKIFFVIAWLLLVAVVSLSTHQLIYAVETEGFSVMPAITKDYPSKRSWFVYEAAAKTVIEDRVDLMNRGNKTVTLMVAALDGAVSSNGGYTLVGGVANNKDIGTWVKLEETEVTLPPKSNRTLNFTVTVPDNADVGSHPGGIVIWEKPAEVSSSPTKKKNGSQLSVVTRIAARMYLTVPGDIQRRLKVKQVSHSLGGGVLYFMLHLKNSGNVQLTPIVDITLRGLFGRAGTQAGSQIGMLLRGTEITAQLPWQKDPPAFGRFVADFRLHYGEQDFKGEYVKDEYIDVRYVFWIIQWIKLLWFIGGVILLLLIRNLWLWLLIQSRLNTRTKKHKVKKGETLMMMAGLYGVHPKWITKFNLLKWPYELTPGDILLIPQGKMTKVERLSMGKEWNDYYRAEKRKAWLTDLKFVGALLGKIRFRCRGGVTPPRHPEPTGQRPSSDSGSRPGFRIKSGMTKGVSLPVVQQATKTPTVATEALIAERGDTLYDIAKFAGISVEEIVQLNGLRPPYRLKAGQEIVVPIKKPPHRAARRPKRTTRQDSKTTGRPLRKRRRK
jgi:LysM repeat protein